MSTNWSKDINMICTVTKSAAVYEGSDEDLIYIADLNSQCTRLQQRIMDGAQCVLKHIAFADDLSEMGMNATVGDDIYLLDSPTDFTQPAYVLS